MLSVRRRIESPRLPLSRSEWHLEEDLDGIQYTFVVSQLHEIVVRLGSLNSSATNAPIRSCLSSVCFLLPLQRSKANVETQNLGSSCMKVLFYVTIVVPFSSVRSTSFFV